MDNRVAQGGRHRRLRRSPASGHDPANARDRHGRWRRHTLFPLTKDRAKPAVPLGGKYRLVDIPISNCLNSGLRSIYVLTQFNTMSLHRHIQASYKFDNFSRSFVDILAAQQTPDHSNGIRELLTLSGKTCAISSSGRLIIT